jgi:oligoendopeptidase F
MSIQQWFQSLNSKFMQVSGAKERLFWTTFMGTGDDEEAYTQAETAYQAFISDAQRLQDIKEKIGELEADDAATPELLHGLKGWQAFFETYALANEEAGKLADKLISDDTELFSRRKQLELHYTNTAGEKVEASTLVLSTNLVSSDDEDVRKTSHDALLDLERWAVNNGFLNMIKGRNAFARAQGYRNYFDLKVNRDERMSPEALFAILDDFEAQTRAAQQRGFAGLSAKHGEQALAAHNLKYYTRGNTTQQMDPYLPFSKSLQRWVESFGRMGVGFRDANLTLDLLDRKGKFENGFMHSTAVAWNREGEWQPASINFTSNANPDQVGSGGDGLNTLFHEGGHAAHFANVSQNAPCFSQEFAPTTMSYAETQSMFFDSLLSDADWLCQYARNQSGESIPAELVQASIAATQPFAAYGERCTLVVPYFEWALYSLPEEQLKPDTVIALAREWEQKILGLDCAPRPLLAIPHLLDREAACSYHGYLLAHMAVYQTRAWFRKRDGFLTDNPRIGPSLAEHYWAPGNSVPQDDTLRSLTGETLSADHLAAHCNRLPGEVRVEAEQAMTAAGSRTQPPIQPLQATIRVVHGDELLADNSKSDVCLMQDFETWVDRHYG